ncbi:hypothetical protein ACIO3S_06380 [Nocardioides sp. NPDC087217]|uniref:hypothetical protein n=1 Tax=Nocardioides sp. NPDC087217 TaxID=3364335 RepID=UPI0038104EFA
MPEAIWALLGVGVGAVIPALTTLYQARKTAEQAEQDRNSASLHAAHDRQDARDSRLFDLRRESYVEFQSEVRRMLDWFWAVENILGGSPEPRMDDMDRLIAAEAKVQLFGTEAASTAARKSIVAINTYAARTTHEAFVAAEDAIRTFGRAGRTDLGARD